MAVDMLAEFFGLMRSTIPARRSLTEDVLASRPPAPEGVARLRDVLAALEAIPREAEGRRLGLGDGRAIHVDLAYEIEELKKDILYLEEGEDALLANLAERHPELPEELSACVDSLKRGFFQAFVSDRDGTVNNYCGRYASSVQSTWNAVFLTRFARVRSRRSVILTSAPLSDVGIVDMSVVPASSFVLAGSKGREYLDAGGAAARAAHRAGEAAAPGHPEPAPGRPPEAERKRDLHAGRLRPPAQVRPDHHCPRRHRRLDPGRRVRAVPGRGPRPGARRGPRGELFRIEDTGLDLEIVLTVEQDGGGDVRDFDKGDGVRFLDEDTPLAMERGACLVCGDTASDVPMLEASLDIAPHTRAVFVTRDEGLRQQVRDLLTDALFVSEPDTLVAALNALARPPRA